MYRLIYTIFTYISHKDIKFAIRPIGMEVALLISAKLSLNLKSDHFSINFRQFKKAKKKLTAHYEPKLTTTKPCAFIFLGVHQSFLSRFWAWPNHIHNKVMCLSIKVSTVTFYRKYVVFVMKPDIFLPFLHLSGGM